MIKKLPISVIILTYNEELHIRRCIERIEPIVEKIFIVDSFSTDNTVDIACSMGAEVLQNKWENNHAKQFNWGLDNCSVSTGWIMRLDADEYLDEELMTYLCNNLESLPNSVTGLMFNLKVCVLDKKILKYGKFKDVSLLRLWRKDCAKIEARWMDEHVELLRGRTVEAKGCFIDHNLNGLTWWTEKHNKYANREVVDIIINNFIGKQQNNVAIEGRNRKKGIYLRLPLFFRPILYFFLRYIILLGFLDGKVGLVWCFLQGFWYRFLVDAKLYRMKLAIGNAPSYEQIKKYCKREFGLEI